MAVKVAEQWAMAGGVWVLERDDFKDERACWYADGNGLGGNRRVKVRKREDLVLPQMQ